ncbi:MAG: DNA-binding protein WhiA [Clostridia bacterium]|nr:DNA-binding protein WhiA [Clostridia bacterium]
MSFNLEIKKELCRLPRQRECCAAAECMGMLLYSARFSALEVRMQSESAEVRRRAAALFRQVFGTELLAEGAVLHTENAEDIRRIYGAFGYEYKNSPLYLNRAVLEEPCCESAFLRGAFLMGGCVSAAGKGYHLELVTSHYNVSRQTQTLLGDMGMTVGSMMRRGNRVLYSKDSSVIEHFLGAAGATGAAMELMLKKVERELRNKVNRSVNCETANLSRTLEAARLQIETVERLKQTGRYDELSPALKQTAELRCAYPDLSLAELCELFDPPLSKPGLSNRLRKLTEIARDEK